MTVSTSAKSREAVMVILGLHDRLSIDEISDMTGLSRATVHRVISVDPRISYHKGKGKAWLYSIDKEALAVDFRVESMRARRLVSQREQVEESLVKLTDMSVNDQIAAFKQRLTIVGEMLERLREMEFNAHALQTDGINVDPMALLAIWNEYRGQLEQITVFGQLLAAYCDSITESPSAHTPTWWQAFPKEKS